MYRDDHISVDEITLLEEREKRIENLTSQGWQCPMCGFVYSPYTSECFNCNRLYYEDDFIADYNITYEEKEDNKMTYLVELSKESAANETVIDGECFTSLKKVKEYIKKSKTATKYYVWKLIEENNI